MRNETVKEMTRMFRALSVEKRVEIVRLLSNRTLCVGALSRLLGISPGAVSQHLRILKDAGIVEPDRRGYYVHYSLAPDAAAMCRGVADSLFKTKPESKKGDRECVAERRNAGSRRR
ncbi:MAG TPA: metalloregulator ArsR/SmtB family transcription factor [Candidatus Brocadiia bacterium]|nr:metalloregulator ArsR/SmtB family transcription factor [Candidatus Brocadiia bacterium]